MEPDKLKQIIEAALLAADEPLTVEQLEKLFKSGEVDGETIRADIREILAVLEEESAGRGYEVKRVASGYRYQVRQELSVWISRLWEEKPPRYTRALLETLSLVAYKQPVTRGDIEQVRGVSVSQSIMRTLLERGWIRIVGQREVPGKPSMYGTTKEFLDYFNLKSLDQLPPLAEIRALIEPLVVEEAGGEIPGTVDQIANIESKMEAAQAAQLEDDATIDAPSSAADNTSVDVELGESVADAEQASELIVEQQAQVVEVVAELDDVQESEQPTADVVQLPTSPH